MAGALAFLALAAAAAPSLATTAPPRPLLRGTGNVSASQQPAAPSSPNASVSIESSGAESSAAGRSHIVWSPEMSYCLSADGNRIGNGVRVQLWKCDHTWQSSGQDMYKDRAGWIRMRQNPGYCVVVDGDKFVDGAQIQLWRCEVSNWRNQAWSFDWAGQIQAVGPAAAPMCLAIDGDGASNGARIQLRSCSGARAQSWTQLALGAGGRTAYAVPDEDKSCAAPFLPVSSSLSACAAAAEAMQPGGGCQWGDWAHVVERRDKPTWPQGCYFYGACQGGCGLDYNPVGAGGSCPTQGSCMSISVLCQLPLP